MPHVTLFDDEIAELEKKLQGAKLPPDEAKVIEFILDKAKAEKARAVTSGPGWLFTWTYRF